MFVYMNLNTYSVLIRDGNGYPITVLPNKAVKGDFFARFAAPNGALSMVPEVQVAPDAIIYTSVPRDEKTEEIWKRVAKQSDPYLVQLETPEPQPEPVVEAPVEEPAPETVEAAPAVTTSEVDEAPSAPAKKTRKKKTS